MPTLTLRSLCSSFPLIVSVVGLSTSACSLEANEEPLEHEPTLGVVKQHAISPLPAEVRAGRLHTCARRWDGRVVCWGAASNGQMGDSITPPPAKHLNPSTDADTFTPALASGSWIAAGADRACARSASKDVTCWGTSPGGWPGGTSGPVPALVPGVSNVDQVVISKRNVGGVHRDTTCVRSGGIVKCWGGNDNGVLGTGSTDTLDHPTPATIPNLGSSVAEIALGEGHACARFTNGTVTCWGSNSFGQLGNGSTNSVYTVGAPIAGLTGVVGLALGSTHSCALKSDGSIRCWGEGGTVGDGTTTQRNSPHTLQQLLEASEISAGTYHTCARMVDGTVQCWGANTSGQLGLGNLTNATLPMSNGLSDIVQISVGEDHSCALSNTSVLKCWGNNLGGQIGDGTSVSARLTPTTVIGF